MKTHYYVHFFIHCQKILWPERYAYNHFLDECNLLDCLSEALEDDHIESSDLRRVGKKVRKLILESEFPEDLAEAIIEAYKKLGGNLIFPPPSLALIN